MWKIEYKNLFLQTKQPHFVKIANTDCILPEELSCDIRHEGVACYAEKRRQR